MAVVVFPPPLCCHLQMLTEANDCLGTLAPPLEESCMSITSILIFSL